MSFDILGSYGDTSALWDAAAAKGADSSFTTPTWAGTVDLSQADVSTAAAQPAAGKNDSWWQSVGQTIIGYAIVKDATKNGVTRPGGTPASAGGSTDKVTPTGTIKRAQVSPLVLGAGAALAAFGIWHLARGR